MTDHHQIGNKVMICVGMTAHGNYVGLYNADEGGHDMRVMGDIMAETSGNGYGDPIRTGMATGENYTTRTSRITGETVFVNTMDGYDPTICDKRGNGGSNVLR